MTRQGEETIGISNTGVTKTSRALRQINQTNKSTDSYLWKISNGLVAVQSTGERSWLSYDVNGGRVSGQKAAKPATAQLWTLNVIAGPLDQYPLDRECLNATVPLLTVGDAGSSGCLDQPQRALRG
ncbi:hypothetical protein PROFUN_01836 [Planoprotostelium fungivorum]|uniref:Uncharacterized protein n=1 Tax=Planoprotostelium fungivorum TaxID=1890364 RepID=A0A2P6NYT1_9EUKA|nr:hypothetical protein PROFUN_01836 [Planoprotostelium fungivorum]